MIEENISLEDFFKSLRSLFGIPNEVELALQRYDKDWNEEVDIETIDSIQNLDKLSLICLQPKVNEFDRAE